MKFLVIGGAGIIGKAFSNAASRGGHSVLAISRDTPPEEILPNVTHLKLDRHELLRFAEISKLLQREHGGWDVLVDIVPLGGGDAQQVLDYLAPYVNHVIIISTTLVYARSASDPQPIPANHPLAEPGGLGGYVDGKLEVEHIWRTSKYLNWTFLRPYHVLGSGSLLGCLPFHNRDQRLVQRLMATEELALCRGGRIEMNYIHPDDLAEIILRIAGNPMSFSKAFNTVYPENLQAYDYYKTIADVLGVPMRVRSVSHKEVWDSDDGWELTTMPHVYEASDLYDVAGFIPLRNIKQCVLDALTHHPSEQHPGRTPEIHQRIKTPPRPKPMHWLINNDGGAEIAG